jgi:hypothetical protein
MKENHLFKDWKVLNVGSLLKGQHQGAKSYRVIGSLLSQEDDKLHSGGQLYLVNKVTDEVEVDEEQKTLV